ncbi:MAG: nitrous oxide reductase accessory protein NosL [Deltaproteobacteria bacterium]
MRASFVLLVVILLVSCRDKAGTGPVEIHYGEDVCERCKMIISEKNFAAQYLLPRRESRKFDDLGCLVEHFRENENEITNLAAVYVVDFNSGGWTDGKKAFYLRSGDVNTPMGYGIIAFGDRESLLAYPGFEKGRELGGFGELIGQGGHR